MLIRAVVVFVIAVIVISARRWPQLVSPDVWVEDGTKVLPSLIRDGWLGIFEPVNGYLIVPAKVVSYAALSLSFDHYAIVSTVLAVIVQAAVVASVAVAPSILPWRILCALLIAFLPIGAEAYALPLYVFWWTTILLFVGLFWDGSQGTPLRLTAIVIGGLSSPFVVVAWPIFALRAAFERSPQNTLALATAFACAAIQAFFIFTDRVHGVAPDVLHGVLPHIGTLVSKYFGTAIYGLSTAGRAGAKLLGVAVVALLIASVFAVPRKNRLGYILLGLCLAAAILASVTRVPVEAPHPLLAGPRYFFFTVLLTGWMLLYVAALAPAVFGLFAMFIAGAYIPLLNLALRFNPQVPVMRWEDQVAACVASPGAYTFTIQYGLPNMDWAVTLSGDDCRRLVARDVF